MIGGIIGCIIVPPIADKIRKRTIFVILSAFLTLPTLVGMSFTTSYTLLVSGFLFGFFFLRVGPIIYQYSAEISYPTPEAISQELLVLASQIFSIIYIFGMDA